MTIPLQVRFEVLQRDSFTCRFCGRRAPETELEVDHVKPRSGGGTDERSNLVAACRDCNRGKGDRPVQLGRLPWDHLVAKLFHTRDADGFIERQGCVVGALGDGYFTVQWFEWASGLATYCQVVHLSDMARGAWAFYGTAEEMRESYEHGTHGLNRRPEPVPAGNGTVERPVW